MRLKAEPDGDQSPEEALGDRPGETSAATGAHAGMRGAQQQSGVCLAGPSGGQGRCPRPTRTGARLLGVALDKRGLAVRDRPALLPGAAKLVMT